MGRAPRRVGRRAREGYWGRGYGVERASAFVELTVEQYGLAAFVTTHAATNEPSRRVIETDVERSAGRHEGPLRQPSPRPDGEVTDQHRHTITREEYETATANRETRTFELEW
ncbi:MAG: GNAT family N-acetyltransferase [Halobacteriales archaeon]